MSKAQFLTPQQYRQRLDEEYSQEDPAGNAQLVAELEPRRFPWSTDAGHYYLPVQFAASVYLVRGAKFVHELGTAFGPPQVDQYWQRLAGFTKYVYRRRDWRMFGRLAYQIDWSLAACEPKQNELQPGSSRRPIEPMTNSTTLGVRFSRQLMDALDLSEGRLEPTDYLEAALGYFQSLPTGFAIPPDLVNYPVVNDQKNPRSPAQSPTDWPMLRFFWKSYREVWSRSPRALEELGKSSHPFLQMVSTQWRTREKDKDTVARQPPNKQVSPPSLELFTELAGKHGEQLPPIVMPPPKAKRPFSPPVPQTGRVRGWWNRARLWWRRMRHPTETEGR